MLSSLFGSAEAEGIAPGEDATEKIAALTDRLASAGQIDVRRDAVRQLKAAAPNHKVEVFNASMPMLLQALADEQHDQELVVNVLETTILLVSPELKGDGPPPDDDVGVMFTEIFVKDQHNVALLLSLLHQPDFYVKFNTIKLLTRLLHNRTSLVQQCITRDPTAVGTLVDLLVDSAEVIRNEALLLIAELTKENSEIKKILAFGNVFDHLLSIIMIESASDGGVIVSDCIHLIDSLLRGPSLVQTYFRETSYIAKVTPFFHFPGLESGNPQPWRRDKVDNVIKMLTVIRLLVSPENPKDHTFACQSALVSSGLLARLFALGISEMCPNSVLSPTLATIAEAIRGHPHNQQALEHCTTQGETPALRFLLQTANDGKRAFLDRCAALYCFQARLEANPEAQESVCKTCLPQTGAAPSAPTLGTVMIVGILGTDALSSWFADLEWASVLRRNRHSQTGALRIAVQTGAGVAALFDTILAVLAAAKAGDVRRKVGLLLLLITWTHDCPEAVHKALSHSATMSFLVSQITDIGAAGSDLVQGLSAVLFGELLLHGADEQKEQVQSILDARIRRDAFQGILRKLAKSDVIISATKAPQITEEHESRAWLDMNGASEVCEVISAIEAFLSGGGKKASEDLGPNAEVVAQYQQLIRDQDARIEALTTEVAGMKQAAGEGADSTGDAPTANGGPVSDDTPADEAQVAAESALVSELRAEVERLSGDVSAAKSELQQSTKQLAEAETELEAAQRDLAGSKAALATQAQEHDKVVKDSEDLLICLAEQHERISSYRQRLVDLGQEVTDDDDDADDDDDDDDEDDDDGEVDGEGDGEDDGEEDEEEAA